MLTVEELHPTFAVETAKIESEMRAALQSMNERHLSRMEKAHRNFLPQYKDAVRVRFSREAALRAVKTYEEQHRREMLKIRYDLMDGDHKAMIKLQTADVNYKSALARFGANELVSLETFLSAKRGLMNRLLTAKRACLAQSVAESAKIYRDSLIRLA